MRANSERESRPQREPRAPSSFSRSASPSPDPAAAGAVAPAAASAEAQARAPATATAAPADAARVPRVSTTDLSPSAPRGQFAATGYHLVLLARDYQGWSQLCRIVSAAHLEHRGEAPQARVATIAANHDHLIALSGCRRGEVGARLVAGDKAGARAAATAWARLFGRTDFYIELIDEQLPGSARYVQQLDLLARELRLPTVATNDVHYTTAADAPLHDILAAEAANQPLPNPLGRRNSELTLKTPEQMWRLFGRYPQAYRNTARIAARCNLDLGLGRLLFPAYPLPPGETAYSLLVKHCFTGAAERYSPVTPEVLARLQRELKVIEELGFAEYFLAVRDIVQFTRERGIYYSGRGSAGNSIVSYVLHITDADPIANDLLFERFLNPARREMPDIDIDFESARRDEVIEYIYERFGHERVAMVANVNTVRAPSAVRIVARAFDFRPDEIDALSKKVPWGSAAGLSQMLAERPELANHEFRSPHYRRLVDYAERLAGFPYILGTHLGGFILSRDPITDRVPLQWAAKGVIVAQFNKDDVETLGLVKMDILGLRMHSAIAEAVRLIAARTGEHVSAWEVPRDDPAVYRLIGEARTIGVFQLESSGQRNLALRLRERDFEDVIAAISLFRPGPAAGRDDRALHPPPPRAREGARAPPRHVAGAQAHLRRHPLPGAGDRGGRGDRRLLARRRRPAAPRHDPRALPGRDGPDRARLRHQGGRARRRARHRRRGLSPAARLCRLRLQQGARRLLCRGLQRQRLAQGALPGRVLLRPHEQPAHGLLLAAGGVERRPALGARGAAGRRQPERVRLFRRSRRPRAAGRPALRQRDEPRGRRGHRDRTGAAARRALPLAVRLLPAHAGERRDRHQPGAGRGVRRAGDAPRRVARAGAARARAGRERARRERAKTSGHGFAPTPPGGRLAGDTPARPSAAGDTPAGPRTAGGVGVSSRGSAAGLAAQTAEGQPRRERLSTPTPPSARGGAVWRGDRRSRDERLSPSGSPAGGGARGASAAAPQGRPRPATGAARAATLHSVRARTTTRPAGRGGARDTRPGCWP